MAHPFDEEIRRKAGHRPEAEDEQQQRRTTMDGGARQVMPTAAEPSFSSTIEATRRQQLRERETEARSIDSTVRTGHTLPTPEKE
jgi:hypothetical protein